jgi:hypothetical protein
MLDTSQTKHIIDELTCEFRPNGRRMEIWECNEVILIDSLKS